MNNKADGRGPHKPLKECLSTGSRNERPKCLKSNKFSDGVFAADVGFTDDKKIASNLKKFLKLGLLDGVVVKCFPKRSDVSHSDGTSGIIFGSMIHCLCKVCEGLEKHKMSPTTFEMHAGNRKKYPADNFYLANLKTTIKDIMNECMKKPNKEDWGTKIDYLIGSINGQRILKVCKSCEVLYGPRMPTEYATSQGSSQQREQPPTNILADGSAPSYFGYRKKMVRKSTDDGGLGLSVEERDFSESFMNFVTKAWSDTNAANQGPVSDEAYA